MEHACVSRPTDSLEDSIHHGNPKDVNDINDKYDKLKDHEAAEFTIPSSSDSVPKKLKAKLTYNRTANKQLMVAPCGIILGRETFYGAEAHGTVWVSHFVFYHISDSNIMLDMV